MKFIELSKAENNQKEKIDKFRGELNVFKMKYDKDYDFDLLFHDAYHLVVQFEESKDFNSEIHEDICNTFDVRLQYVSHVHQQNPNKITKYIELIYTPVSTYVNHLDYNEDVVIAKNILFK